jgi:tetratricopeptide (TPR) repeat protein
MTTWRPFIVADATQNLALTVGLEPIYHPNGTELGQPSGNVSPELWVRRGDIFAENGDWDQATGAYKKAIRLSPRHAHSHLKLGLAMVAMHDKAQALEQYAILKGIDQALADQLFDVIYK